MLIEFRVENHRSIRDEQVLTMEVGRAGTHEDPRPRDIPGCAKKVLPVAALYGANASGKSNVLSALSSMREAVIHSLRNWSPDEGIPQDPFAWGQISALGLQATKGRERGAWLRPGEIRCHPVPGQLPHPGGVSADELWS